MMHRNRQWSVANVASHEELVEKLSEHDWCSCNAFRTPGGTVWANDSTPAGIQEYAVLRVIDGRLRQVESITVSWCSRERLLNYIRLADSGAYDAAAFAAVRDEQLEEAHKHQPCVLCS